MEPSRRVIPMRFDSAPSGHPAGATSSVQSYPPGRPVGGACVMGPSRRVLLLGFGSAPSGHPVGTFFSRFSPLRRVIPLEFRSFFVLTGWGILYCLVFFVTPKNYMYERT